MRVFTRAQVRELDRLAVQEFGVPGIVLMENAARGVAEVVLEGLESLREPGVLVVCGPGNNGGDGFAIARHLANSHVRVAIVSSRPVASLAGDARTNAEIAARMGLAISVGGGAAAREACARLGGGVPDAVIDAVLGTGLDRAAEGVERELIGEVNRLKAAGASVVAVDLPSGLDADTGRPAGAESGVAVKADLTVSLAGVKAGFLNLGAQEYVGDLLVVDIGAPSVLLERLGRPMGGPAPEGAGGSGCCRG